MLVGKCLEIFHVIVPFKKINHTASPKNTNDSNPLIDELMHTNKSLVNCLSASILLNGLSVGCLYFISSSNHLIPRSSTLLISTSPNPQIRDPTSNIRHLTFDIRNQQFSPHPSINTLNHIHPGFFIGFNDHRAIIGYGNIPANYIIEIQ